MNRLEKEQLVEHVRLNPDLSYRALQKTLPPNLQGIKYNTLRENIKKLNNWLIIILHLIFEIFC